VTVVVPITGLNFIYYTAISEQLSVSQNSNSFRATAFLQ